MSADCTHNAYTHETRPLGECPYCEIDRLKEVYRREREAHAANLREQQKCEAEIARLKDALQQINTMSCVMGYDSGHAGIDAAALKALADSQS